MSLKKKCQVVMLPTNKKATGTNDLVLIGAWNKLQPMNKPYLVLSEDESIQHLYITSDDKPKKGDWCYCFVSNTIFQIRDIDNTTTERTYYINVGVLAPAENSVKIIATTDNALSIFCQYKGENEGYQQPLPKPSPEFVKRFIESYNNKEIIKEVMVTYEGYECPNGHYMAFQGTCSYPHCNQTNHPKLKVDNNNQITITKVKEIWNREEVSNLLRKLYYDATGRATGIGFVPKWIEENV